MPKWVPRKSDWGIAVFASFFVIVFVCISRLDRLCSSPYLFLVIAIIVFLFFSVPIAFGLRLLRQINQSSSKKVSRKSAVYKALAALAALFLIYYVECTLLASAHNSFRLPLAIFFQVVVLALIYWRYTKLRKRLPKN